MKAIIVNNSIGSSIFVAVLVGMFGCTKPPEQVAPATVAAPPATKEPVNSADMLNGVHYPNLSNYYALMKEEKYSEARNFVIVRFGVTAPDLKALVADAEIKGYIQTIKDPKASKDKKQNALLSLAREYPDHAKPYAESVKLVENQRAKAAEKKEAADQRKMAAEARKRGVSIGMTMEEVIASSWGRPSQKNRTITSHGIHEQWVYGGGYLYFEDGILRTIQN